VAVGSARATSGQAVTRLGILPDVVFCDDLPLTESDAATIFGASVDPDPVTRTHMVLIAFDAARLRWTRLVSLGMTRESGAEIEPGSTDPASTGAA